VLEESYQQQAESTVQNNQGTRTALEPAPSPAGLSSVPMQRIEGVVLAGEQEDPLSDASIMVYGGTLKGTRSNLKGQFTLEFSDNMVVAVSKPGYITKVADAGAGESLQITLSPENENAKEIAYKKAKSIPSERSNARRKQDDSGVAADEAVAVTRQPYVPAFPTIGYAAFFDNLNSVLKKNLNGSKFTIQLSIDSTGEVISINMTGPSNPSCLAEVTRLIKATAWNPAIRNGEEAADKVSFDIACP